MKKIIIMCLLALLVISDDVIPADDACSCVKLMSENDCKAKFGCAWTAGTPAQGTTPATQGSCGVTTTPTTPTIPTYCFSVADQATKCASTTGCAYVDSKCTHFTGCTAYVKTTNADCQAISALCITDGTQCIDAKSCNEYTIQTACEANPSISGIKICKWDNGACRDYVCTEAASTLTTNADCSAWLSGCVTTGKGCIQTLGSCASYTGDDVACGGLKGTDGNCEGIANGTNCRPRTCAGASTTLTTDADCVQYQIGCVTNGKGCVTAPLPACASYSGDNTTCVGYIGSDGTCEGDAGTTSCRARICSNAPVSNNSDSLCATYKAGCVTTGKGCIAIKGACSSYSGTTTSCSGYVGTDGLCKGSNATISSPCAPKVCMEAPNTTTTDEACAAYQINCKTTGKGCVSSLGACSSYTGTTATCDGYVGTDGKCKGNDPTNPAACAPKVCTDAPASVTTNESCAQFQTGCVTNGAGCVSQVSCINTIKQISCLGTSSCGWNSICVASANCSDFLTVSICSGNNAINGSTSNLCYWDGSSCRNLACIDAPTTYNSDGLCNTFLSGCWTKGNGCLPQSAPCSSYQGNQSTCAAFSKKCWNTSTAISTTACTERTCADDTTSTSDNACGTFKTGCRTKGTGCIDQSSLCTAYQGTQSQCDAFRGNNGTIRCWNTSGASATTACAVKACTDNTIATTDVDCGNFLDGCVTNGSGCILKSEPCASYNGSQTVCATFKGSNAAKLCWYPNASGSGSCVDKDCTHAPTSYTTDSDCGNFLSGCLTNGGGCVSPSTACSSYNGNLTLCATFTGNYKKCYKADLCADRLCADKPAAADNTECTTYLSTCRYFKGGCVNAGACNTYGGASLAECQDVLDNSPTPLKCWWETGGTSCVPRSCTNAPSSVASQTDCNNHKATGCIYNGNNKCALMGTCDSYSAPGADDTARLNNCKAMTDTSGNACWFITGATNCTNRTCANVPGTISGQTDCNNHKTGCQYNGTACVDTGDCTSYAITGSDDAAKLSKCKAMKNASNKTCFFVTGASNCTDPTCANVVAPISQTGCDTHLSGQCYFKSACESRTCSAATSMNSTTDCGTWLTNCQWDGKAASSCVDQSAACPTTFPIATNTDALKQAFCETFIVTSATKPGCQLKSDKSACETRTCAGAANLATKPSSTADCDKWLANCQWDGVTTSSCVDQSATCPTTFPTATNTDALKQAFCETFIVISTTNPGCQLKSDKSACETRTCAGAANLATKPSSTADCDKWLANCQWDGKTNSSCVDQISGASPNYPGVATTNDIKKAFCEAYIISGGSKPGFQFDSTDAVKCQVRTCDGAANLATRPSSTADCGTWLNNCKWDGKANSSCFRLSTVTCPNYSEVATTNDIKKAFCEAFILQGDTKPGCLFDSTNATKCVARTCADAANLATKPSSTVDCDKWLANCQWDGKANSSCVDQVATICPNYPGVATTNDIKKAFCEAYILSGYTKPGCQFDSTDAAKCVARTCAGAVNFANNTSDCGNWKANCQWDGKASSSCVDQVSGACPNYPGVATTNDIKKAFCEAYILSGGNKPGCQFDSTDAAKCVARTCAGAVNFASSTTDCGNWKANCQWDGKANSSCVDQTAACPTTFPTATNTDALKQAFCEAFIITSAIKPGCQLKSDKSACETRTCATKTNATSASDCKDWLSTCRYNGNSTCINAVAACTSYIISNAVTTQKATCEALTNSSGDSCQQGTLSCVLRTCANAVPSASASDCSSWLPSCVYTGSGCLDKQTSCASYTLTGTDNTTKRTICTGLTNDAGKACVFVDDASACAEKACNNVYPTSITKESCESWLGTSCRYVGTTCQLAVACNLLNLPGTLADDSAKRAYCSGIKDDNSNACTFKTGETACTTRTCDNIPTTPALATDCSTHLSTCTISNPATAVCITKSSACNSFTGTVAQCKAFSGVNGTKPCWSVSTAITPAACIDRACTHNSTATSDIECNEFLTGCKTKGVGCVDPTAACSTFLGNTTTCIKRKASDNNNYCKFGTKESGFCKDKTCYDDGSSTTDDQCKSFMSSCLTNGAGCIPNTEPCTSYRGAQTTCAAFTGSSGVNKCWNTSAATATTACVDKKCSDDTTSVTDQTCAQSLTNCVTKGIGCIEKSALCSVYTGNQSTCQAFKGNNGTTLCWNLADATATTTCVDKACTHNTIAISDADCDTFLPRASGATQPRCVTNGAGCVSYPRNCSQFTGNTEQCSNFKASDGPCKSTLTTGSGTCTPRICSEASNNNNTEALCQAYHPTCHTTGYGCATSVPCSNVSDQNACTTKTGCSWVNNCRSIGSDCAALTTNGASICVNTPVTTGLRRCAWYNNACRAVSCQDLSDGLKTDDACKAQLSTCTTKGDGCITKGACGTYSTETICKAAKTIDVGDTCIWDSNSCRAKKCTDATIGTTTDDGCSNFLTGCKTNGATCISSGFNCTSLVTSVACQKDGSNRPCLWVNSVCYNYVKCEDITMTAHTACQAFSPFCTTDGTKCIAISTCARTSLQVSCITGTDGTCGWLPAVGANAAKCQKFGACSDAVSTDKATCMAYGSTCITDGAKCIVTGTCGAYTTQIACEAGGTDGTCIFSSNACRLRECTDATATNASSITTHSGCSSFSAKSKCTTNGTSCIAQAACSSYTVEVGCELGTDGICTWALPVGTTASTTKSCRLKVCQDFTLNTSAACSTALTGAGIATGCVSNGTTCIVKSTCSTYTSKEACNGGGTDGLCAFTPGSTITPTIGTCKLMTACSDANNDSFACAAKSAVCSWKVTTSGTTTTSACNAHDCTTKAVGTDCNPVPSFDSKTYSICIPTPTGCVLGAGTSLNSASCYGDSLGTYTWNASTRVCTACFTRTPDPGTNNGGGTTGSTQGTLLNTLAILLVLATMVA